MCRDLLRRVADRGGCYTETMSADELLAQVLGLPRGDRARVAEEILASLEEAEEDVAASWSQELMRRSSELADGSVTSVPWAAAREQILAELKQRRGG